MINREDVARELRDGFEDGEEFAGYFLQTLESLNAAGYRIVKLGLASHDPSGPDWTSYFVTEEL